MSLRQFSNVQKRKVYTDPFCNQYFDTVLCCAILVYESSQVFDALEMSWGYITGRPTKVRSCFFLQHPTTRIGYVQYLEFPVLRRHGGIPRIAAMDRATI